MGCKFVYGRFDDGKLLESLPVDKAVERATFALNGCLEPFLSGSLLLIARIVALRAKLIFGLFHKIGKLDTIL